MDIIQLIKNDLYSGFSKSGLENLIGLPKNSLSNILSGKKKLSQKSIIKIERFMTSEKPDPLVIAKQRNKVISHGLSKKIPEYEIWVQIKARCLNHKHARYSDYGGRGIKICDRWIGAEGFSNFLADMGRRPSEDHSIDRWPNNDGDYELSNCRWATDEEQRRNKRNNRWFEFDDKKMILQDWAKYFGVNKATLIEHLQTKTFKVIYEFYTLKMKKKKSIQELKDEGLVTTADKIPEPEKKFVVTVTDDISLVSYADTANTLKIEVAKWILEIEEYCNQNGITPEYLIELHETSLRLGKKAAQILRGDKVQIQDFTRDKSVGKPYDPFDNPFFKSKMASNKHEKKP